MTGFGKRKIFLCRKVIERSLIYRHFRMCFGKGNRSITTKRIHDHNFISDRNTREIAFNRSRFIQGNRNCCNFRNVFQSILVVSTKIRKSIFSSGIHFLPFIILSNGVGFLKTAILLLSCASFLNSHFIPLCNSINFTYLEKTPYAFTAATVIPGTPSRKPPFKIKELKNR